MKNSVSHVIETRDRCLLLSLAKTLARLVGEAMTSAYTVSVEEGVFPLLIEAETYNTILYVSVVT